MYINFYNLFIYINFYNLFIYMNFYNLFIYIINTAAFFQDFKLTNSIEYFTFKIIQFIRR